MGLLTGAAPRRPRLHMEAGPTRRTHIWPNTSLGRCPRTREMPVAHEFTIRDDLLVRFKVYGSREQALEAAGLSE